MKLFRFDVPWSGDIAMIAAATRSHCPVMMSVTDSSITVALLLLNGHPFKRSSEEGFVTAFVEW